MIYLGFLTTAISVPKGVFIIHRFAYVIIVILMSFFFVKKKLVINRQITLFFLLLLLFSFISVFKENASVYLVFRSFAGLLAIHMVLFSYFKFYNYDYQKIFRHYIIIALISSYVGIFQEISYLAGFVPGYDFSWFLIGLRTQVIEDMSGGGPIMRISSLFSEPGYLAAALTPAGFLAIHNLITGSRTYLKRMEAFFILVALMLTFSSLGYSGMILSLLFNLNWRILKKAFIPVVFMFILIFIVMSNIAFFQSRVSGIWSSLVEDDSLTGYENASSLIIAVNYNIAKDNFLKRPLIGSGFDSYQIVSQESIETMYMNDSLRNFIGWMDPKDMMYEDGGTMYFRVITEFGLFGICSVLWFVYVNKVKEVKTDYSLLQKMCIVFFLTYSLRTGQYIRFELWYFIGFYYCIKKYYDMNKQNCLLHDF